MFHSNRTKSWLLMLVTILLSSWKAFQVERSDKEDYCLLAKRYFESQGKYEEYLRSQKYDSSIFHAKRCLAIYDGNISEYKALVSSFIEIGQYDSASKFLQVADELYPFAFPHSEIKNLRNFSDFKESSSFLEIKNGINTRYRENHAKLNKVYIAELKKLYDLDQKYRTGELENSISPLEIAKIDKANFRCLRKLIKKYGFPQLENVGPSGATAGFLILQHSTQWHKDNYLDSIEFYNSRNMYNKSHAALFIDRYRMDRGLNQIYGSQVYSTASTNYEPVLWNLVDTVNVNYLRLTTNLNDLNSYLASFGVAAIDIRCE